MYLETSIPYDTVKVPPPAGDVLAWDERIKRYAETSAGQVMAKPRVYPFWLPERRRTRRAVSPGCQS